MDIPTISRWLGHSDGGALAMRVYGHLQVEHSLAMSKRVSFEKPTNFIKMPKPAETKIGPPSVSSKGIDRRAVAKAKAKYEYPWWASEDSLEILWGQLHEEVSIVPEEKLVEAAKRAMGRELFRSELRDRQALIDEMSERIPEAQLMALKNRIPSSEIAIKVKN